VSGRQARLPRRVQAELHHRVVIEHIDFPTVEGGKKNYRPFTMSLESDSVFTLEL